VIRVSGRDRDQRQRTIPRVHPGRSPPSGVPFLAFFSERVGIDSTAFEERQGGQPRPIAFRPGSPVDVAGRRRPSSVVATRPQDRLLAVAVGGRQACAGLPRLAGHSHRPERGLAGVRPSDRGTGSRRASRASNPTFHHRATAPLGRRWRAERRPRRPGHRELRPSTPLDRGRGRIPRLQSGYPLSSVPDH
jgi:hypothetical protein